MGGRGCGLHSGLVAESNDSGRGLGTDSGRGGEQIVKLPAGYVQSFLEATKASEWRTARVPES
jgi:hypothetical protein